MELKDFHREQGASVADDGIPLHYADLKTEYHTALHQAVLFDRSHEARLELTGEDRFALPNRMSTNELLNMGHGEGRPTIFTNSNARILDRVIAYNYKPDALLMAGGPGRGSALRDYLQRNIFFKDQVKLRDLASETRQFDLHGPQADKVAQALFDGANDLAPLHGVGTLINGIPVFVARRKSYTGSHWMVIAPTEHAVTVWKAILKTGQPQGLIAAGSLTFNALRIRSGRPGVGRELSSDYIPLEVGLFDEISFHKGCYTGQEIIARMESRNKLARTIVSLRLSRPVNAPADLMHEDKRIGTLTSSVTSPDGEHFGIGVVKVALAVVGQTFTVGEAQAEVTALPGFQPPMVQEV
jgi:folate-binding protein YgfZ